MQRLFLIFILLLAGGTASAQPRLELRLFKPNTPDYYYYQLSFATFCGDSVIYDLRKQQLILEEQNGRIDTNSFQIDRFASPDRNSCYELVLAFDNSSTVAADLPSVIMAGRALIDTMRKPCDLAAVISFDDRPTLRTFLSNDRDELRAAVDAMAISGRRALYDGISAGITTLYTSGTARVQAVLAFTTGNDNSSGRALDDLLADARRYGIRIFIVAMGASIHEAPLRQLCEESGGVFSRLDSAAELVPLYRTFAGFIAREFDEHRITRRTNDVTMQNLRIRMRLEACTDSIWAERVFNPYPVVSVPPPDPLPSVIDLGHSYPNPFSPSSGTITLIPYTLPAATPVRIVITDVLGRVLRVLIDAQRGAGGNVATWDGRDDTGRLVAPGMYFVRLHAAGVTAMLRITVVR